MSDGSGPDPWAALRRFTPARIGLGRAGHALPTGAVLDLALAHARARDAVRAALDSDALARELGPATVQVASAATDRARYLARPDLGRRLGPGAEAALAACHRFEADLAVVVADGLAAPAAERHAVPLLRALRPRLDEAGIGVAPIVIARQARVALGDAVAALLGARAVLILIGERPGLSAPDSLGAYLTVAPRPGRTTDAERNCLSNIRPGGLGYAEAAFRLAWLIGEALRRGLTGVALKDESRGAVLAGPFVSAPSLGREQV